MMFLIGLLFLFVVILMLVIGRIKVLLKFWLLVLCVICGGLCFVMMISGLVMLICFSVVVVW